MADKKVSALTSATTPLAGTEELYVVQGSNSRKVAASAFYIPGGTDVPITDGGTGASTAADARSNLGVAIGSDVQAFDAGLASIAGLTTSADNLIYTTASDTYATSGLTAFARTLLDDEDAETARATLGVSIGTDIQAHDALLDSISGLTTTTGDIIYTSAADTAAVLNIGTAGQVLQVSAGGVPEWGNPPGGGDMLASIYDPQGILDDAFARANHTGTQAASTISDFDAAADARITAATGVSVQAYSANLDDWSALATSAKQDADSNLDTLSSGTTTLGVAGVALLESETADDAWNELGEVTRARTATVFSRSIPVNPLEFGAVGDGVTDDTAALQAWASSGGPLVGVPQTFRVTDTIDFTTDFSLDGRGMEIEHDTADPNPVVQVTDVEQFSITGLKIDGRKDLKPNEQTTAHGIRVEGCDSYIIEGNHIRNTHEHAISGYSTNDPEIIPISSAIVCNNIIKDCGNADMGRGYGIWFFGYIEKVIITGNHIRDCVSGIGYDDASGGGGFRDSREAVISGNVVFTHLDAIRFESSSIGSITGNVAVSLHDGTVPGGSFICGMMVRAIQSHVDPCNRVTVTGNYIQGPQFGFYSADVEDLVVSGNVIKLDNVNDVVYGSNRVALKIDKSSSRPCRNILITGNMIRSDERGIESNVPGSVTDYIENVSILGNTVIYEGDTPTGTAQRGIYVSGTYDAFVKDNEVKGFYDGIMVATLPASTEPDAIFVVTGNISADNVNNGIMLGNDGQTIVYGNVTRGNGGEGISYSSAANTKNSWRALNFSREASPTGSSVSTPAPNYPFPGMEAHSASALGASGSTINTVNKYQGKVLIDTTNNRLMYAVGPAPTDDWRVVDGSASITPA